MQAAVPYILVPGGRHFGAPKQTQQRKPLGRPCAANQVWSMDSVFDRTAEGHVIKNLTVVDDATHDAVAILPERAIGGLPLIRNLDPLESWWTNPFSHAEQLVLRHDKVTFDSKLGCY